ncbi:MAG: MarR family transcriptional regulator [Firmicutes bacterium]|jgi:DNA-binding MarR family transcriptional regulator|nr:MarR family transcriptional regulator [Bacillota bacterium]
MEITEFRNSLWEHFRYLRMSMDALFRPIVEDLGLTMLQARILIEVQAAGRITVGELGETIGSGSGNASTMCKRLEQLGCVRRERAASDERVVYVSLTPEGESILAAMDSEVTRRYAKVLANWPAEDFAAVHAGTQKIREILDALRANANTKGG